MYINLKVRSYAEEQMDELSFNEPGMDRTLVELDFINQWLGGNQISLNLFRESVKNKQNVTVMDMGCGSGLLLQKMIKICRANNQAVKAVGIDANEYITAYAQQQGVDFKELSFSADNVLEEKLYQTPVDIIHACLFTHHFTHEELVWLLKRWKATATTVIINDLHRHTLAYYSIKWLTRLFSKSEMVINDAPLSVARGFKKRELIAILKDAGIEEYRLTWKWAFRWSLVC